MRPRVSVVLPAYNEEGVIETTVRGIHAFLSKNFQDFEIIVVDDGSRDRTADICRGLEGDLGGHLKLLRHEANRGYGAALRTGLFFAEGEMVFYTDADNQFDISELPLFISQLEDHDLVIGHRVRRNDKPLRRFSAKCYNLLIRALFGLRIRDIDCSFKLFRRELLQKLSIERDQFFIDAELLLKARAEGARIKDLPVTHLPRKAGQSKVRLKHVYTTLCDIAYFLGRYHRPVAVPLVLGLTLLSFVISPLYMVFLRHRFARDLPMEWESVSNNGRFAYASSLLITAKNIEEGRYATKVRQAYLHGFPYDPYIGDRSLKSWLFDCLAFYPLALFLIFTCGNLQWAWVLAHAVLGALWVWGIYRVLRGPPERACLLPLLAAAFIFFFNDSLRHLLCLYDFPLQHLRIWLFLLFAYATGQIQWMRLPTPGLTALFPFALLCGAYRLALADSPRRLWAALLGAAMGLLCLAHAFEWVVGCAALGLFFVIAGAMGLGRAGRWNLGIAAFTALVVSLAYYFFCHRLTSDIMPDIIARVGAPRGNFQFRTLFFLAWAALFLWRARGKEGAGRWRWALYGSVALSVLFAGNFSVVLGYDLQFYGHTERLAQIAVLLALADWLLERPERLKWLNTHAGVLLALIFCWVFLREKAWSDTHYKIFGTPRRMEEAMSWVDKNTPPGSLVLSLSGVVAQQLPLWTDARALITAGNPNYGSPRSTADILRGFARTLKTARVDMEPFLRDRWEDSLEKDTHMQQYAYHMRTVSMDLTEKAFWQPFLLDVQGYNQAGIRAAAEQIRRYYREEPPASLPYYLWVNRSEERLLLEPPERRGGVLAYENPAVRIYAFK
ncbi:MAG: glycosyltransferase family 2 protein [Elusimicrobia bacterium]|nr:glycosyltransferase family 2 protein [Elusimicrobiota bacterium]